MCAALCVCVCLSVSVCERKCVCSLSILSVCYWLQMKLSCSHHAANHSVYMCMGDTISLSDCVCACECMLKRPNRTNWFMCAWTTQQGVQSVILDLVCLDLLTLSRHLSVLVFPHRNLGWNYVKLLVSLNILHIDIQQNPQASCLMLFISRRDGKIPMFMTCVINTHCHWIFLP